MSTPRIVVLELTMIEGAHLAGLVEQFRELLADSTGSAGADTTDPAIVRLAPDAYPDDPEASLDFRALTEGDLLHRRDEDAQRVLADLSPDGVVPTTEDLDAADLAQPLIVTLDAEGLSAWLRTLTAIRLVLAARLGITDEDDHAESDPRFGVYDWLGYRLDGLITAADG